MDESGRRRKKSSNVLMNTLMKVPLRKLKINAAPKNVTGLVSILTII